MCFPSSKLRPSTQRFGGVPILRLARIMRDGGELGDDCGKKRAIHIANQCSIELQCASALRHSRHERRYAASV